MNRSFDQVCPTKFSAEMIELAQKGEFDTALRSIATYVDSIISDQATGGLVFGSRHLDSACLQVGRLARARFGAGEIASASAAHDVAIFLVTEVGAIGGHGRVLMDLLSTDTSARRIVLATNLFGSFAAADEPWSPDRQKRAELAKSTAEWLRGHRAEFEIAPSIYDARAAAESESGPPSYLQKLLWLMGRLASLAPKQVYVLTHPFDSTLIAACQPDLAPNLRYYHNYAHAMALGVHLPHALHIDFLPKTFHNCRHGEGLEKNVYWPLAVPDPGDYSGRPLFTRGKLTTCSSGGFEKFVFDHYLKPLTFKHRYQDLLPQILHATGGFHIHIGALPDTFVADIRRCITLLGGDPSRLIHVTRVDNLAQALVQHCVDLYVTSFPLGGGRAAVEAMSAGIGILAYRNYRSIQLSDANDLYPGALVWDTPNDLIAALSQLSEDTLRWHCLAARRHYETHNRIEHLKAAMRAADAGLAPANPPRPLHRCSTIQAYLDESHAQALPWVEAPAQIGDRRIRVRAFRRLRRLAQQILFKRRDHRFRLSPEFPRIVHGTAVTLPRDIDAFADACVKRAEMGDVSGALIAINALVERVIADEGTLGRIMSSRELDLASFKIGRLVLKQKPPKRSAQLGNGDTLYIASRLGSADGHFRALLAHMDANPGRSSRILLSTSGRNAIDEGVSQELSRRGATIAVAPNGSEEHCLRWLMAELARNSSPDVYLFLHPSDSVSVAAVQPDLVGRISFVHVHDLGLSLGNHLPHAQHIDLRPSIIESCRYIDGIENISIWPLAMGDRPLRAKPPFRTDGFVRTASCGRVEKVARRNFLRPLVDDYSLIGALPDILSTTGGVHIHYGEIPEDIAAEVRQRLREQGIDPSRLILPGNIESLWDCLVRDRIDVCIMTFPYGGGYVAVEAMGAGVPIVAFAPYSPGHYGYANEIYPEAPRWREPIELVRALQLLDDSDVLEQHSLVARSWFERHHTTMALQRVLAEKDDIESITPNKYIPDRLRWFSAVRRTQAIVTDKDCVDALLRARSDVS